MRRRPQMVQESNYITALQLPFHLWDDWFWVGWGGVVVTGSSNKWCLHGLLFLLLILCKSLFPHVGWLWAAASLLVPPCPQHEQLQEAGILNLKFTVWVIYTHSDNNNRQEEGTERKSHQVLTEQEKGSTWIFQNSHAGKIWQYSQCTEIIQTWHS